MLKVPNESSLDLQKRLYFKNFAKRRSAFAFAKRDGNEAIEEPSKRFAFANGPNRFAFAKRGLPSFAFAKRYDGRAFAFAWTTDIDEHLRYTPWSRSTLIVFLKIFSTQWKQHWVTNCLILLNSNRNTLHIWFVLNIENIFRIF